MSTVLACDLGGTHFRAALIDMRGRTLASQARPSPAGSYLDGRAEIPAEQWWDVFCDLVGALAQSASAFFGGVEAIAICGVTRTQVLLDEAGHPVRAAMTWRDTRAADSVGALLGTLPPTHPELAQINPFHPLARLDWLRRHEPASLARAHTVLEPKDYLNFRLTGARAGDPVSMARLRAAARPGPDGADLFTASGLDASLLPAFHEPAEAVGPVQPGLPGALAALRGRPVFCCANDTWAAVAGLGALRAGYAYNISGTTEVFGVIASETADAPAPVVQGLMTVDWGAGLHQIGGPGQNGADTMAWLLSLLSNQAEGQGGVGETIDALLAGARDAQPLLFLPYLQGERVPYWDANLRGAFIGLNRRHGAGDLAWAVIEGVAFLNRIVLERGESALGGPVGEIRFGGGAAANPRWCQAKADICGRPVSVGLSREPGTLGAAVVAWTGLGHFASLEAAQQALVQEGRRYLPDALRQPAYDALYRLYRDAETAVAPLSHLLSEMKVP